MPATRNRRELTSKVSKGVNGDQDVRISVIAHQNRKPGYWRLVRRKLTSGMAGRFRWPSRVLPKSICQVNRVSEESVQRKVADDAGVWCRDESYPLGTARPQRQEPKRCSRLARSRRDPCDGLH